MSVRTTQTNNVQAISFGQKLVASPSFTGLFREGMSLVEEAAAYLDGVGRGDAKELPRTVAMGYASESMRMTTRLMQLASWLLLQRAVNEGEMNQTQAGAERRKLRLSRQDVACSPDVFERLPEPLKQLSLRSLRLQARVLHLDGLTHGGAQAAGDSIPQPVSSQLERLRAAFPGGQP